MFQGYLWTRGFFAGVLFATSSLFWIDSSYAETTPSRTQKSLSFLDALDLKLVESIDLRTAIYKDKAGTRLYVRYVGDPDDEGDAGGTAFESVADVIASNIYATLVGEEIYANKFIFSRQNDGQRIIWGVAIQPKNDFHPLWGQREYPAVPSNMERNALIWRFLGMPSANEAKIGFDSKANITRTDFYVAFTEDKQPSFDRFCINTQLGTLHKLCNLALVEPYEETLLTQSRQILSIVSEHAQSFRDIENVTESVKKIQTFLENRFKDISR